MRTVTATGKTRGGYLLVHAYGAVHAKKDEGSSQIQRKSQGMTISSMNLYLLFFFWLINLIAFFFFLNLRNLKIVEKILVVIPYLIPFDIFSVSI